MKPTKEQIQEALEVCNNWLAFIDREKEKTTKLAKAAALARRGDTEGARRMKNEVDSQPRVFDGANLLTVMPAIQSALKLAKRLQSGEVSDEMKKAGHSTYISDGFEIFGDEAKVFKKMAEQLMKEVEDGS